MAANIGIWFRWWVGCVDDPKLSVVSNVSKQTRAVVIAIWACILERAASAEVKGNLTEIPTDELSVTVGVEAEAVDAVVKAMRAKGMLDESRVVSWEKRQPIREDESSYRVRKHRDMKRNVTQCNAVKRNVTQCNAPETETETETESYKEREEKVEKEEKEQSAGSANTPPAPTRKRQSKPVDDDAWVESLQTSDAYKHVDVRSLLSKMVIWCNNKGKVPTRQRLLNWLNREERPMNVTKKPSSLDQLDEEWYAANNTSTVHSSNTRSDVAVSDNAGTRPEKRQGVV